MAAVVITAAVVVGLNALANLAAGPAPVPAVTTTVQSPAPAGH